MFYCLDGFLLIKLKLNLHINLFSALDQLISQMRRLYGDMSFQVTRPNGTKSNAIVEVHKNFSLSS